MDLLNQARAIINEVDAEMAKLFVRRMRAVEMVAEYKKNNGMPILDEAREGKLIEQNSRLIEDDTLREYYVPFLRRNMELSRT